MSITMKTNVGEYTLTRAEQETIWRTDNESRLIEIGTLDPIYIRKLDKLCEKFPDVYKRGEDSIRGERIYTMPKKLLRFGQPLSDAQRAAAQERASKLFGARWRRGDSEETDDA